MRLFLFQRIRLTRFITLIEWASVYPKSLKKTHYDKCLLACFSKEPPLLNMNYLTQTICHNHC